MNPSNDGQNNNNGNNGNPNNNMGFPMQGGYGSLGPQSQMGYPAGLPNSSMSPQQFQQLQQQQQQMYFQQLQQQQQQQQLQQQQRGGQMGMVQQPGMIQQPGMVPQQMMSPQGGMTQAHYGVPMQFQQQQPGQGQQVGQQQGVLGQHQQQQLPQTPQQMSQIPPPSQQQQQQQPSPVHQGQQSQQQPGQAQQSPQQPPPQGISQQQLAQAHAQQQQQQQQQMSQAQQQALMQAQHMQYQQQQQQQLQLQQQQQQQHGVVMGNHPGTPTLLPGTPQNMNGAQGQPIPSPLSNPVGNGSGSSLQQQMMNPGMMNPQNNQMIGMQNGQHTQMGSQMSMQMPMQMGMGMGMGMAGGNGASGSMNVGGGVGVGVGSSGSQQASSHNLQGNPTSPNVPLEVSLTDQGTRLKLLGKIDEAMEKYKHATKVNDSYAPAFYNIGVIYSELGKYEEALRGYQSALARNSQYVEAYCNIGVIYKNIGVLEAAVSYYEKALSYNPNFKIARNNMAIALTDLGTKIKNEGDIQKSIEHYKKALVYNAQYPDAFYNLGVAYGEMGEIDKAIVCYELGIHFNPMCCEAYNNLGVIFKDRDNLERATECYMSALRINPKFSQTLNNLGVVYTVQGKLEEAYKYVKLALDANPVYAEAFNNLGVLCRDEGRMKEAITCYERCLLLSPSSRNAGQNRLLALNYVNENNALTFQSHKDWGEQFLSQYKRFTQWLVDLDPERCIRVGYISPDYFTHSVSYFIEPLLKYHDQSKFQIVCYSNVLKEDAKTQTLRSYPSLWRTIFGKGTDEVALQIYNDKIDILIELTGHTAGNRLDVIAMKPSPIQITYIGYPNTTGLSTVDYRFTDEFADPPDTTQEYVEQLIRLPRCFLCYQPIPDPPLLSPLPASQRNYVTFGSFNNLAKITHKVIEVWSSILKRVPTSRLIMKCKPFASPSVQNRILTQFQANGIESSRVDLLLLVSKNVDHLAAYSGMDISLDPWPYAGTTTTCESLLMGVPVITLKGNCHAHNVGVSLLSQVGLGDWIATSEQHYIQLAVQHAQDLERLANLRSTLRDKMLNSYLCNGQAFTQNYENVLRQLWQNYCAKASQLSDMQNQNSLGLHLQGLNDHHSSPDISSFVNQMPN